MGKNSKKKRNIKKSSNKKKYYRRTKNSKYSGGAHQIIQIKINVITLNGDICKVMLPEDSTAKELIILVAENLNVDLELKELKLFKHDEEIVNNSKKINALDIVDGDELAVIIEQLKCSKCQNLATHIFGTGRCCGNCCPNCQGFGEK